ncbi:MAG TPA: acyl transferase [Chitinophagales bacterium]|nr:acyl transferase [Chitinophagales bacterium]
MTREEIRRKIFDADEENFEALALEIFQHQISHNEIYREYCSLLREDASKIQNISDIPFLPIEFFKTHRVVTGDISPQRIFTSSGTTSEKASRHFVSDLKLYEESFLRTFKLFFGEPDLFCILALLPSYLERSGSSLVFMVEGLMNASGHQSNGFYLYNQEELHKKLLELETNKQRTILAGVTFALLDFAEKFPLPLHNTIILETGGMKGRREEITREELHTTLKNSFHTKKIYSEYGMTELLSQAYSPGDGKFLTPPWMKVLIRDVNDPLQVAEENATGAINIIDFANLDSCSFIATDDVGKMNDDGTFEVMGRMDHSDVRGCNLMWEEKISRQ